MLLSVSRNSEIDVPRARSRRVFVQKGAVGQELPSSAGGGGVW